MTSPESEAALLREALEATCAQLAKAADQFAFYADEHAKKKTADGDAKGMVNHQWALACAKAQHVGQDALARTNPSAGEGVPESMVLISRAEYVELKSRMPWAGGQSPFVCGSGSAFATDTQKGVG